MCLDILWANQLQHLNQNGQESQLLTVNKIVNWRKCCNTNQGNFLRPTDLLPSHLINVGSNRELGGNVRCRLGGGRC